MKFKRHVTTPEGSFSKFTAYHAHQLVVEPGKLYVQPDHGTVVVAAAWAYFDYDGPLKALAPIKVRAIVHGQLAWEASLASIVVAESTDLRVEQLEARLEKIEAWINAKAGGTVSSSREALLIPLVLEPAVAWHIDIVGDILLKDVTIVLGTYQEGPVREIT